MFKQKQKLVWKLILHGLMEVAGVDLDEEFEVEGGWAGDTVLEEQGQSDDEHK